MALGKLKTEHSGAKHGSGAYWGTKKLAKWASNKKRRLQDRRDSKHYVGD